MAEASVTLCWEWRSDISTSKQKHLISLKIELTSGPFVRSNFGPVWCQVRGVPPFNCPDSNATGSENLRSRHSFWHGSIQPSPQPLGSAHDSCESYWLLLSFRSMVSWIMRGRNRRPINPLTSFDTLTGRYNSMPDLQKFEWKYGSPWRVLIELKGRLMKLVWCFHNGQYVPNSLVSPFYISHQNDLSNVALIQFMY